jgi:hypothetical protein
MKFSSLFFAAVLLLVPAAPSFSQTSSLGTGSSSLGGEKAKELIPTERQFLASMCSAIQMQSKLAQKGAGRSGTYMDLGLDLKTICDGVGKEAASTWTKLVDLAQARNADKSVPQTVSRHDLAELDKLEKVPNDKWHIEFVDLLLKEVRQTSNSCSNNVNFIKDPDLKKITEDLVTTYKYQIEQLEAARKAAKAVKMPKEKAKH